MPFLITTTFDDKTAHLIEADTEEEATAVFNEARRGLPARAWISMVDPTGYLIGMAYSDTPGGEAVKESA